MRGQKKNEIILKSQEKYTRKQNKEGEGKLKVSARLNGKDRHE